jgi:hypothetical protein
LLPLPLKNLFRLLPLKLPDLLDDGLPLSLLLLALAEDLQGALLNLLDDDLPALHYFLLFALLLLLVELNELEPLYFHRQVLAFLLLLELLELGILQLQLPVPDSHRLRVVHLLVHPLHEVQLLFC